ncbi:barstar family protein [Dactylosporangium sp. NPDC006015]|uniref:barstar family protein n=1 Tax=Dactylosporangium sp. NPDC006015 TaxID=3154576 RepID=UPI0033A4B168
MDLLDDSVDEAPFGTCVDVEGMFGDAPPPLYERFVLVGCRPEGRLRAAVTAGAPDGDVGTVVLDERHTAGDGTACGPIEHRFSCVHLLLDATVTGHRPSGGDPELVDVELTGLLHIAPGDASRYNGAPRPAGRAFLLSGEDADPLGSCQDTLGLYRHRPEPEPGVVTWVGVQPEAPLAKLLTYVPGGSAKRRRVQVTVEVLDGAGTPVDDRNLDGLVTAARPSRHDGLLDIVVADAVFAPFPSGAPAIWRLWDGGRPETPGSWTALDRTLRHVWSGIAIRRRRQDGDSPAGGTYLLDGTHVTDIEGLYCALGEAVNGPGGYFGWNLNALDDCLRGGWGARAPFTLVWQHAGVARRHLVAGFDRHLRLTATTMDDVLAVLHERGVEVHLR